MRNPISQYCFLSPANWHQLRVPFVPPEEEQYSCNFVNGNGIQMLATVKDYGKIQNIHVTIVPIYSLRQDLTKEEMDEFAFYETGDVLKEFFGYRYKKFLRQPDDPRHPQAKHYFYMLDENE